MNAALRTLLGLSIGLSAAEGPHARAALDAAVRQRVDAVFAEYTTPGSPGCALGVIAAGQLLYERGYGLASLEHGIAIDRDTVFDLGSVSKQFTAAAVLLLAQDGKLALDDDVRRHVPELRAYERPITIRHLLSHTSGLRDYTTLLALAGYDDRDVTTVQQALDIVVRQQGLDFPPGDDFRYSNTGFFLASIIVERVSKQDLDAFAQARIFRPLGMTSTRIAGPHSAVVPRFASAYRPGPGGFAVALSDWEQTGDGAVRTSVADLARWARNFETGQVGGRALVETLEQVGALASGAPHGYGLGQFVGEYRGLRRVHHGGTWAGFRAVLQRYPSVGTAIAVLCNVASAPADRLADQVADVVLAERFTTAREPEPLAAVRRLDTPALQRWAGVYWSEDRAAVQRFEAGDGAIVARRGTRRTPLEPLAGGGYRLPRSPLVFRFLQAGPDGRAQVERSIPGFERYVLTRQDPWVPDADVLRAFAGTFRSDELGVSYMLRVLQDGTLARISPRDGPEPLEPAFRDTFEWNGAVVRFTPDRTGFEILTGRARGIRFVRASGS